MKHGENPTKLYILAYVQHAIMEKRLFLTKHSSLMT